MSNEQVEANKELVLSFVEAMRTSDTAKLADMIHDDFSWWIIGKPDYLATAGEHDGDFFLGFFGGEPAFAADPKFTVTSMIGEGNSVAAEAHLTATTAAGTAYDNHYHFLFTIKDSLVLRMNEYMDTHHAKVTFGL